ncbi:uncharacterized protein TrAtP1_010307 [Trichoderma atroviride]|uniref:uncharacterized protein n=1 Tax=Hypocrea atroviridis TaxID=63577 RepID=UPI00331E5191|nr:hypothetical protein TrAtP1_010307 [Trichoderma atroviride]
MRWRALVAATGGVDAGRSAHTARAGTGTVEGPGLRVVAAATVISPCPVEPLGHAASHLHPQSGAPSGALSGALLVLGFHLMPPQMQPVCFSPLPALYLVLAAPKAHPGPYPVPAEPITAPDASTAWLLLLSSEAVGLQRQLNWLAAYTACSISLMLRFGGL